MLVIDGIFENGVFIPEKPLSHIKGRQKARLSIEETGKDQTQYETLSGRNELYAMIQEGIDDIENGKILTEEEVLQNMERALRE
jgi:predicted transcriptional regulator